MTHRCAFCRRASGRRGGTVWLKVAGRRIAICALCAAEKGFIRAEVVPEEPTPLEAFEEESQKGA